MVLAIIFLATRPAQRFIRNRVMDLSGLIFIERIASIAFFIFLNFKIDFLIFGICFSALLTVKYFFAIKKRYISIFIKYSLTAS